MKRALAVLVGLVLALAGSMAVAAWLSRGTGSASAAATTVDQANAPLANRSADTVSLSWDPSTLANGAPVAGYDVFRHVGAISTLVCTVTSTTCVDTTPVPTEVGYGVVARIGTNWRGPESDLTPFTFDDVAPVTTAEVSPAPNGAGWNRTTVAVTLTATDSGIASGVDQISYTLDGGSPVTTPGATVTFPVSGAGDHPVTFHAVDAAGNVETTNELAVRIDPSAPTTLVTPSPEANGAGWNNTDVTLDFDATDAGPSGVASITVDGVTTSGPSASTVVTDEGTTAVSYFATDVADNVEGTKSTTVRIDKTDPTASIDPAGGSSWTSDSTVAITSGDTLSGVASVQYAVDGGALQSYVAPVELSDGTRSFRYVVTDFAGNVTDETASINVDTLAPGSTIASTTHDTWTITATDAAPSSGVTIEYWIDNGTHSTVSDSSATFAVPAGPHTIRWFARDGAGNQQAQQEIAVTVFAFAITSRTSGPPQNTTVVQGTGAPGASVTVHLCGGTQTSCGPSGPSSNPKGPQTTTVGPGGIWSVTFDKLGNGAATYTAQARQTSPNATSNVLVFTTS